MHNVDHLIPLRINAWNRKYNPIATEVVLRQTIRQ
jgi:hypothetical protein